MKLSIPEVIYHVESVTAATALASGFVNSKTIKRLESYGRDFLYTQPVFSALANNNADTMAFLIQVANESPSIGRDLAIEALRVTITEGASQILGDMALRYNTNHTTSIIDALKYRGTESAAEALVLIGQTKTRTHGVSALSALLELQRETPAFAIYTRKLIEILAYPENIAQYIGSALATNQNPASTPLKMCFDEAVNIQLLGNSSPKLMELFNGEVEAAQLTRNLEVIQNSQQQIHATLFGVENA